MTCDRRAISAPAASMRSSITCSSPACAAVKNSAPCRACSSWLILARARPRASCASTFGSRCPAISCPMMSRPVIPCTSASTAEILIAADSSSLSARFLSRVRSPVRSRRYRVCSRISPNSGVATKHGEMLPRSKHTVIHTESGQSRLGRPGRFLTCRASASTHSNPSASSRQNGPFQ
jgi:hypothetical protein